MREDGGKVRIEGARERDERIECDTHCTDCTCSMRVNGQSHEIFDNFL